MKGNKNINIAIAEDHEFIREGMVDVLNKCKGLSVLFDVSNGKELLDELRFSKPDVIILDIDMPKMNGHEALRRIKATYPDIMVVMLSYHYAPIHIREFIKMGASAFLPKYADSLRVIQTIKAVYRDGYFYDQEVSQMLSMKSSLINNEPFMNRKFIQFTDREIQILELLCSNKSNEEIAKTLKISLRTVEGNRFSLMQKTGAKNLAALAAYAIQSNILAK